MFCTLGHVVEVFFTGVIVGAITTIATTVYAFRKRQG